MGVLDRFRSPKWAEGQTEERASALSMQAYADAVKLLYDGHTYYTSGQGMSMPGSPAENIGNDFEGYVRGIYYRSGVVAACMYARHFLFTEARFKWRALQDGKMFGDESLSPLEHPWPGGSTGELLGRMEQDASLAGNSYTVMGAGGRLHRLRPDWVTIVIGSDTAGPDDNVADAIDAEVVGYMYHPGGVAAHAMPVSIPVEQMAHYSPLPDPLAHFRGMSWLTPILREIQTHGQATDHKGAFFTQGATPNFAITYPAMTPEQFKSTVEMFSEQHEGTANAHKTLHLAGGGDPKTLGVNLKDLDYKAIQGGSETLIAAAARVPAVVVGIAEALGGSALNSGNYGQARRQFGEQYAYPSWRMAATALSTIVPPPAGAELWYDTSDVAYLAADRTDAAEVTARSAESIRTLTDGGYDPQSVVDAVQTGDLTLLQHTGKLSVQLQEPGTTTDASAPSADQETPPDE